MVHMGFLSTCLLIVLSSWSSATANNSSFAQSNFTSIFSNNPLERCGDATPPLYTAACIWVPSGLCTEAACDNQCLPASLAHHKRIDDLIKLKATEATNCADMAISLRGLFQGEEDYEYEEDNVFSFPSASGERRLMTVVTKQMTWAQKWMHSHSLASHNTIDTAHSNGRSLKQDNQLQGLACPTDDDIDLITPSLNGLAQELGNNSVMDETLYYEWKNRTDLLTNPEALKSWFASKCTTENVTADPLKSMYLTLMDSDTFDPHSGVRKYSELDSWSDYWHADSADGASAWPEMVVACRPKDGNDARILQTGRLIKDACEGVNPARGVCLKPEQAKLLNKQCFDAIIDLLEATEEQAATIFSALSTIHIECMDATSQSGCSTVQPVSEMNDLAVQVLEMAKQGQVAFDKEDTPSEGTTSEDSPPVDNASDDGASDDDPPVSNTTVAAKAVAPTSDSPKKMKISGMSIALALFVLFVINI